MSYPPPPGLNESQSSSNSKPKPPSSLPPRPPPSSGPPPSFSGGSSNRHAGNRSGGGGFSTFTGFQPRAVAAQQSHMRTSSPVISAGPTITNYSASPANYGGGGYQHQQQQPYQQSAGPSYYPQQQHVGGGSGGGVGYGQQPDAYTQPTPAPQIKNPFAPPGQSGGYGGAAAVDPEMEAQIAQWQSAYVSRDDKQRPAMSVSSRLAAVDAPAMSTSDMNSAANTDTGVASVVTGADGKQKTVVRSGGGQTWQDPSLLEWDPAHFRLFVGNLAGEVTDESLMKAFSRYNSVEKARVVRDKRTTKSKGYGFVSFSDGDDYFNAAREMNGKYIGSHPVLVKKSTTEIKAVVPKDKRKNGKGGKGGGYGGDNRTGAGVQKKQKTKGGLKILG